MDLLHFATNKSSTDIKQDEMCHDTKTDNLKLDLCIFVCSAVTAPNWQDVLTCSLEHNLGQSDAPAPAFESQGSGQLTPQG